MLETHTHTLRNEHSLNKWDRTNHPCWGTVAAMMAFWGHVGAMLGHVGQCQIAPYWGNIEGYVGSC